MRYTLFFVLMAVLLVRTGGCEAPLRAADLSAGSTPPEKLVRIVADTVLRDFPEPPEFNWGEGVLMSGMMRAYRFTRDERYLTFVRSWADHWNEHGIEKVFNQPYGNDWLGYCGFWGSALPVLTLYQETRTEDYLKMCSAVAEYIMTQATRTSDGGFDHWKGNGQLWVDTLYMTTPVLANYGRIAGQPEYLDEAVRQFEISTRRLQDAETGLYYHMYDDRRHRRVGCPWGRGNGWVIMSRVEIMKNLDPENDSWKRLAESHRRQIEGLLAAQDKATGMWHSVLDATDTYVETSATAMVLFGLAETCRLGLADECRESEIQAAWQGLAQQVNDEGRVIGVSNGTGPGTKETYARISTGTHSWGTGAFLLAACACAETPKKQNQLNER